MKKLSSMLAASLVAALSPLALPAAHGQAVEIARDSEAVVLTGAQLPRWSRLAAQGVGNPGATGGFDGVRDAHHGRLVVPPDARSGVPVDQIAAYALKGGRWVEVPVQVDERFPYFLANANSDFGVYSGVDEELTYEWDVENWKKTAGECEAEYHVLKDANGNPILDADGNPVRDAPMQDPVATLDDDDEIAFMASDAGEAVDPLAPIPGPPGTGGERHEVRLVDPLDPTKERFVYLFLKQGGSSFTKDNGYVSYTRDANADEYIDQNRFERNDPELLGSSNTGYGPNLGGTVCGDNLRTDDRVETSYTSNDRFPRDGVTVTTESYRWRATGRWMVRGMQVAKPEQDPNTPGVDYGADLIDRWKGRAFQQSPDSSISLVGFEDEQVNWEGNSTLLGERMGPVRAIRETWGADSGTNVTKTETFYRDAITYRYRVRVHPIPPDGLYTSWDYNAGVASTYFNELTSVTRPEGVPIDGRNDDLEQTQMDEGPNGEPMFFDVNDPTFNTPLSFFNWEQVSGAGDNGSLVYMFELKNAQSLENPLVVPYYRDDACLDDGTGDDPSPRAYPGESYQWMWDRARLDNDPVAREYAGYDDPATPEQPDIPGRPCYTEAPEGYEGNYLQGCFGCHGIHYFVTGDTDNSFQSKPTTEIDGQQWQWAVPTSSPTNVGDRYALTVKEPLIPIVSLQTNSPGEPEPEEPEPTTLELTGASSGQTTDAATLAARLTSNGQPVSGEEIVFSLDGAEVGRATTDVTGVAQVSTTLSGPARDAIQAAAFAGDNELAASNVTAPFRVEHEDTATALEVTRTHGNRYAATATLTESDPGSATPLGGQTIRFLVDGKQVGSGQTDGSGRVSVDLGKVANGATVEAVFDATDTFLGSSARQRVVR